MPVFYLQIADANGIVAQLPAGTKLEADFVSLLADEIGKVHLTRQGLEKSISEAIYKLKLQSVSAIKP